MNLEKLKIKNIHLYYDENTIRIEGSGKFIKEFQVFFNIPCTISCSYMYYRGNNALDLAGKLLEYSTTNELKEYLISIINILGRRFDEFSFKVAKTRDDAVIPTKAHPSDSGYDLTILEPTKQFYDTVLYETGIKVAPSFGWSFDIVPRSSIIKTGYMLANNVGIIDSQYRDSIKVALIKVVLSAPTLQLPLKIAQLIPRQRVTAVPEIIDESEFDNTLRGEGGFGSTDK